MHCSLYISSTTTKRRDTWVLAAMFVQDSVDILGRNKVRSALIDVPRLSVHVGYFKHISLVDNVDIF